MTVLKLKEDRERMKNDDQQMVKEELEKMKVNFVFSVSYQSPVYFEVCNDYYF